MSPALLSALTFGAVAIGIGGVYSILSDVYLRDRTRVSQRLDDEFRKKQRERAKKSLQLKDLSKVLADVGELADGVAHALGQRLDAMIEEQSGLEITPQKLQLIAGLSALALGTVLGALRHSLVAGAIGVLIERPLCALLLRPVPAAGPAREAPVAIARCLRPDGAGHPRGPDDVAGAPGGQRRVCPADRRRVRLLL